MNLTIGIEEEFQIIDPKSGELKAHISQLLEEGAPELGDQIKPELHQSVVEVGTKVCKNVGEARSEVVHLRRRLAEMADKHGLKIGAAATHPMSDWAKQEITNMPRYLETISETQDIGRGNLIFGLHVHVGIDDKEDVIAINNQARYFLPHMLAISSNSPFWIGRNTGLKSYRCEVFKRLPRTDIPGEFESWAAFENYVKLLVKTGCIDNGKRIWWDVRPHAFFNTVEFRICDLPMRVDETIAMAALVQSLVSYLLRLREKNQQWRSYPAALIQENKWRAARWGLEGKMIDFGKQEELPTKVLIEELLQLVSEDAQSLGCADELGYIREIVRMGSGADRQLQVYKETGDLRKVVDLITRETMLGVR